MRTNKPKTISDVLKQFVKENHLKEELSERDIIDQFFTLLPPAMSRRIQKAELRGGKLFVSISSATARHELYYQKEELLRRMKGDSDISVIEEIVLI